MWGLGRYKLPMRKEEQLIYGASVSSGNIGPARTEVYCRTILHNIFCFLLEVLGHISFLR